MTTVTVPAHSVPAAAPSARPLFDLLSDAVLALLEPRDPSARAPHEPATAAARYAAYDAPTYLRRGLRIAGLDAADA